MRHSKRATVTAVAAGLALAACGGGSQPGEANGDGATGDADANAWILTGGMWSVIEESFERWNDENPDQQISVEEFENDAYKERIRTAVGAAQAPTAILSWGGGTLAEYANNDHVIDISDQTSDLRERLIPAVEQNGQVDGTTYAVPVNDIQPVVIYYNQDLFDEHGVEVPSTWDEMLEATAAFDEAGIIPFSLAAASVWPELMWIQYLTDRIGGPEVFQAVLDGEADAWSDPAITEALEKIQELVEVGAFGENYASVSADQNADLALVHTGRAAMVLQLSSMYASFRNDAADFTANSLGFAPFPEIEGGAGDPRNVVGNPANVFSVSAAADEASQEAVTSWMSERLYDDQQIEAMIDAGAVPPVLGLQDQLEQSADSDFLTYVYDIASEAPHFQLSWDQALPPGQAQELLSNLSQIFLMTITPQEFIDNMNATL